MHVMPEINQPTIFIGYLAYSSLRGSACHIDLVVVGGKQNLNPGTSLVVAVCGFVREHWLCSQPPIVVHAPKLEPRY